MSTTKLNGKLYCYTAYPKGSTTPGTAYKIYKVTMGGLYIKDDNGAKLLLARNGGTHDWRKFFSDKPTTLVVQRTRVEKSSDIEIQSKKEWIETRITELGGAIALKAERNHAISVEWVNEFNELLHSQIVF